MSVFRCCHTACVASVAVYSSDSVWASPLQHRPGLLRSWGGIANSGVRMMAAVNAASTSSTLRSLSGLTLRGLPTATATCCRSWESVTRRLRWAPYIIGHSMEASMELREAPWSSMEAHGALRRLHRSIDGARWRLHGGLHGVAP